MEDFAEAGIHEVEIINRNYTITIYDVGLMKPDDVKIAISDNPISTIVHEMGHAMEFGKIRLATEKYYDAKKMYETEIAKPHKNESRIAELKVTMDNAQQEVDKAFSPNSLAMFKKLVQGKSPLTPYSKKNVMEAFADAFMLFKMDPKHLKRANKPLYEWFNNGGFI